MSIVHVLDENTINKIAAGEVVERPASVVKELIENAIDAGAAKIEIEIMAGGTSFIRVTDNGSGMSIEDAKLAILRHATSKINAVSDLNTISTLGFRGEALPTISSVSRFSLITRQAGSELGTLIDIVGGKITDLRETGCNIGTTVKVEDLFFNTPARKKFLKTTHTEGSKINDFIIKLALSNPSVAFKFINNNKMAISTPGNDSLYDAIQSIYGSEVGDALLGLSFTDTDMQITGFITKPSMIKSSRTWQTYIVNGRILSNRAIARAIDNAYQSLLPKAGHPLAVLDIKLPQNSIDVNVHPQKSEMKFEDEGRLFKAVYKSVIDAIRPAGQQLGDVAATVQNVERHYTMPMQFIPATAAPPLNSERPSFSREDTAQYAAPGSTEPPFALDKKEFSSIARQSNVTFSEAQAILHKEIVPLPNEATRANDMMGACESSSLPIYEGTLMPIGQVADCYIVAHDAKGLYIVDQHAAHERILYDRFAGMADAIPSQQLLVHDFLDFDKKETKLIEENQLLFKSLGFDMESSGPQQFRLKEVPADIPVSEASLIICEILESLQNMHNLTAKEIRHACLATTACRAAIKAGDTLNIRQMQIILDELANTSLPYTCPHGRPTILKFSTDELAKMFKRT
jgi:DNA mismatch repair protein MutL